MKHLIKIFFMATMGIQAEPTVFDDTNNTEESKFFSTDTNYTIEFGLDRFVPFDEETTYIIYQISEGDDDALEAHFAFEYLFYRAYENSNNMKDRFEASFSYVGAFDFYMSSRYSGPVINRKNNPALNVRYYPKDSVVTKYINLTRFGLSLEHRSNGQVQDVDKQDTNGKYLTQIALEQNDHEYFDGLSRGANYFTLKSRLRVGMNSEDEAKCNENILCAEVDLSYKLYFTEDSDITWGELAHTNTTIKDYDIFRIRVVNNFPSELSEEHNMTLEFDYRIGNEYFDTDSLDINIGFPINISGWKIPLFFKYHNGPMDRLSDYSKEYTTYGLGLVFTYKN